MSNKNQQSTLKINKTNILESPSLSNPFRSISFRGHSHTQVPTKRPMDIYGWLFKLYVRFCVWELSGKNIVFCLQWVSQQCLILSLPYVCDGTNKRIQHTEFSFLPVSKAIKAVSCMTAFRISTSIITFFVGGAS